MLLTGTSMSAAQGRGRACRTSGDRGAARALLLRQDTDGHPGKLPPPPRPGDTSCRVMEAQEHLPAILIPPSRAGQAAPMSPSQPHSNASAVVPSTSLSPQQCPSSPAVSPTPLPAAPWPCRCLFPPVWQFRCPPGEVAQKDVALPWGFPRLSPRDLCLPLCLEAAWGAASWAELPGHPSRLRGARSSSAGSRRRNYSCSRGCGGCPAPLGVALAPRWQVAPLGFAGSREGRVFLAVPSLWLWAVCGIYLSCKYLEFGWQAARAAARSSHGLRAPP